MNAGRQIADMADARAYGSCASLGSAVFAVGGLQSDMQVGALRGTPCSPAARPCLAVQRQASLSAGHLRLVASLAGLHVALEQCSYMAKASAPSLNHLKHTMNILTPSPPSPRRPTPS